ncbi:O-antigen ligase [Kurthia sp. Dielmo]|uniref:O-antigen ligase family protein n=1 Tax=Kurthia sp. Dielmo TaxID=1033738 RepID=UPI0011232073|nr:O-antigen ligase family protein [Kurthia sp. Dielmo]
MTTLSTTQNSVKSDRMIMLCLIISMLTSSYVVMEPAPTDLLLILATILAILLKRLYVSKETLLGTLFLVGFIVANFISTWMAYEAIDGISYFVITLYLIITWSGVVGFGEIYRTRLAEQLMTFYTIGALITALVALSVYFGIMPGKPDWFLFERIKMFFKDPNVFGPYFVLPAVYMLGLLEQRHRALYFVLLIIFVGAVLISFSRAAWLNLAIAVFIFYILPRAKEANWRRGISVYLTLVVLAGVLVILKNQTLLTQFTERASLQKYDNERFASQEAAWRGGVISPLGSGPGQSEVLLAIAPHNVYARIFFENGLLGILTLLLFLITTLIVCVRKFHSVRFGYIYRICFAVIVGHIINGFFIDTLHWRHFWVVLALAWIPLGGENNENHSDDHTHGRIRGRSNTSHEFE